MGQFKIQNNQELTNKNVSLWRKGKQDIKKYYDIKFKKSTNIKTLVFGMLITAIIIIPFALILMQLYKAYVYHLSFCMIILLIGWVMLWICNGLSNLFTIKLSKLYYKENPKLEAIDEVAVFFYETLNPGFMIFTFIIIMFVFFALL